MKKIMPIILVQTVFGTPNLLVLVMEIFMAAKISPMNGDLSSFPRRLTAFTNQHTLTLLNSNKILETEKS